MKFEIITPEGIKVKEDKVDEVEIPGKYGYVGILDKHTPFFSILGSDVLWYRVNQKKFYMFIDSGYFDVLPDKVTILAEKVSDLQEIDFNEVERDKNKQQELIKKGIKGEIPVEEFREAQKALQKDNSILCLKAKIINR